MLSRESFTEIVAAYPWPEAYDDPASGHIWFLGHPPEAPALATLKKRAAAREKFALTDRAFYLHAPEGIGRSKLAERVEAALGVPATARNLNTVTKLAGMLDTLKSD